MAVVFIVDDERAACAALGRLFRHAGHVPVCLASGADLLRVVQTLRPQAILLDVPETGTAAGADGLETLRALRADPDTAHTPVIVRSPDVTMATARAAIDAGAQAVLLKGVPFADVLAAVVKHL